MPPPEPFVDKTKPFVYETSRLIDDDNSDNESDREENVGSDNGEFDFQLYL